MRSPRRSFAAPFVVTTLAALPACVTETARRPAPSSPPGPTATVVESPPPTATVDGTRPLEHPQPPANPPPPSDRVPIVEDTERRWTLAMADGKCTTRAYVSCPKPEAGKPMRTCNPPAPQAYECPAGITDGAELAIVAHGTACHISPPAAHCPPGAKCNPPPPRAVPCPR